jgi:hypothetical protein
MFSHPPNVVRFVHFSGSLWPMHSYPVVLLHRLFVIALVGSCGVVCAQGPVEFKEADLALGAQLIVQHKCDACHISKVGGNGSAIYRPKGRINTAGFLRGMVEQCNTELNLALFPDEVTSIAAVLNREHYKFK